MAKRKITYEEADALRRRFTGRSHGFNDRHPELQAGEVFFCNIDLAEYPDSFSELAFKTKRLGKKAYTFFGDLMEDHQPVFIAKTEREERDAESAQIVREAVDIVNQEKT